MLKTTEQLEHSYEKKLLSTRKRILKDFNKLDYIKMEKLIADVLRYNRLLGLTRRTNRKQKPRTALSVKKINLFESEVKHD